MATDTPVSRAAPSRRSLAGSLLRNLASLKLAVILLVILAAVLAWATILEADQGREKAQWYVYRSQWFIALLALLAVNILAATLVRFPWKKRQIGFVITHVGLLVLLAGSIRTFTGGIDGQLSVAEGEAASAILLSHRSQIEVAGHGPSGKERTRFSFDPGPVDWPEGKTLDFGRHEGMGLKILRFYRHARKHAQWMADASRSGGPALKFALLGPDNQPVAEEWIAGNKFGGEAYVPPARFALLPAPCQTMLEDFVNPPEMEPDSKGVLSVHYREKMVRVEVGENVGKKVPIEDTGAAVEIVEYLPNGRPGGSGHFVSAGDEPKNPILELKIHLPEAKEPRRQLAFASQPLLNLDGVHGADTPVKLWYHHPAIAVKNGAEFLRTPDGKLYCRVAARDAYQSRGEVQIGKPIETTAGFKVSVLEYLPSAKRQVTFFPVELAKGTSRGPDSAVLVEFTAGDIAQTLWLWRGDDEFGYQRVDTPEGPALLTFGYDHIPMGFSLKLIDFRRGVNPGGMGNASFASTVELNDPAEGIFEKREISMNEPLVHGKYTFYQSGFDQTPDGREVSTLTVAYDPGRALKYIGSLMICFGTFVMFYTRGGGWKKLLSLGNRRRESASDAPGEANASAAAATWRPRKTRHARSESQSAEIA